MASYEDGTSGPGERPEVGGCHYGNSGCSARELKDAEYPGKDVKGHLFSGGCNGRGAGSGGGKDGAGGIVQLWQIKRRSGPAENEI